MADVTLYERTGLQSVYTKHDSLFVLSTAVPQITLYIARGIIIGISSDNDNKWLPGNCNELCRGLSLQLVSIWPLNKSVILMVGISR